MNKRRGRPRSERRGVGVAWYSPAEWAKLLTVAADPEVLEATYDEWVAFYDSAVSRLAAGGVECVRVPLDIDELVAWCVKKSKPLNGAARAEFTALKTAERSRGDGEG